MGALRAKLEATDRNPGGQKHQLPQLLARLDPEIADDLRQLLADPSTNFPELERVMRDEYGCPQHYSTWSRWGREWRNGRTF